MYEQSKNHISLIKHLGLDVTQSHPLRMYMQCQNGYIQSVRSLFIQRRKVLYSEIAYTVLTTGVFTVTQCLQLSTPLPCAVGDTYPLPFLPVQSLSSKHIPSGIISRMTHIHIHSNEQ